MGICVEKIVHKECGRRALQVFQEEDGTYNGYCFACGPSKGYVKDPYGEGGAPDESVSLEKKTPEQIKQEIDEISAYPTGLALPERKLTAEALSYFGFKFGVSLSDGQTPEVGFKPYFSLESGELIGYKAKVYGTKQSWWVKLKGDVAPFGWRQALSTGAKKLFITEGEEDAVALYKALKDSNRGTKYEDLNPAVISLPHGAGCAANALSRLQGQISKTFSEVVLVFDEDKAGRDAVQAVLRDVFPNAKVATLPSECKDPNDCLIKGKAKALIQSVMWGASTQKNSRIVWGDTLHEDAKKPAEWGVSWPWKIITEKTRGIRKGETIYIGAAPKMGKSEVVDTLGAHLIKEHGWKVLMAKPEQSNLATYKRMAGKMVGKIFHDPKVEFDTEAYDRAGEMLKGRLAMINLYQHLGWDTLKADIRAAVSEGVDAVFVDPITNLVNGISAGEANTKLQEIAQELSAMALDLNIVVFIMCHLNNPDSGPSHERGGEILTSQFAGSRAMGRSCNYMFGLQGNKDPALPDDLRNMRQFVLLDDREFGEAGHCDLYWDRNTGLFNEVTV